MSEQTLPRAAVVVVGVVGLLLLVLAARTEGYWQSLLINLGTGALLFAALEHMLYGTVLRVTRLVTDALHAVSSERDTEWLSWAEQLSSDELPAVQRQLQAIAPLPTEKLRELEMELTGVDQMHVDERMKRLGKMWVLTDTYGIQPLRQVMASRTEAHPQ
jgi:hypothetical protein